MDYAIILVMCAAWFVAGWYLRARRAVRRGESTARAEREAAIKACARRHKEACIVYQQDRVHEWTGELEARQLRKTEAKQAKDAEKVHRRRAREDEGQDP